MLARPLTKVSDIEEKVEEKFHVSWYIIAYKLIYGFFEFILGLGIAFFGHNAYTLYRNFQSQELLEDPHDLIAKMLNNIVPYLFNHHGYLVFLLILFGTVKIAGAVGLIYKKHWGIDLLLGLTFILLPFQFFNFVFHRSILDLYYIIIGIFIAFYLTNYKPWEYTKKFIQKIKKS
jgi:uncharacterized membrane protein